MRPMRASAAEVASILCVQQLAQRLAGEVGKVGRKIGAGGDRHVDAEVVHDDEGDRLVEGTLHEELDLTVLVGRAHRPDRRRSRKHRLAAPVHPFPETLGPELPVPLGELPQAIGVRHEHVDPSAQAGIGGPVQPRVERGRILQQVVPRSLVDRDSRPGEKPSDVDPHERGWQQAHRRQHAEAAADGGRDGERRDALAGRELPQRALAPDRW